MNRRLYKWWYDHIESHFYNLLLRWCTMPLGGERRLRMRLLEPVSFVEGQMLLDMCCGTGGATYCIAATAGPTCRITGMDLSSGQLRRAKRRHYACPVDFVEGDVTETAFPVEAFDKVFVTHAIHEMMRPGRLATLQEAWRVLKPGGEVIVLELDDPPRWWVRILAGLWGFYWLPGNFETATRRDMFKHGVANEVAEGGFVNVRKHSFYKGVLQTVIGTKPEGPS